MSVARVSWMDAVGCDDGGAWSGVSWPVDQVKVGYLARNGLYSLTCLMSSLGWWGADPSCCE